MPTAALGTFHTFNDNDIVAAKVTDLNTDGLYTSVGTSVDQIDPRIGMVTPRMPWPCCCPLQKANSRLA